MANLSSSLYAHTFVFFNKLYAHVVVEPTKINSRLHNKKNFENEVVDLLLYASWHLQASCKIKKNASFRQKKTFYLLVLFADTKVFYMTQGRQYTPVLIDLLYKLQAHHVFLKCYQKLL